MQETWVQSLGLEDPLEQEIAPIPVFLPGISHGQRSPAGYSPGGHKRVEHNSATKQQHVFSLIGDSLKIFSSSVAHFENTQFSVKFQKSVNSQNCLLLCKILRSLLEAVGLQYIWFKYFLTQCQHQFSSVTQSCPTLCDPMNCSTPGLPVHHQLLEFTQTHVHRVGDAIQPSHPLSSPSPPAPNPSQHQGLFQ